MAAAHPSPKAASSRSTKRVLLLTHDPSLVPPGGMLVMASVAGPLAAGHKEPAGTAFHLAVMKQSGNFVSPPSADDEPTTPKSGTGLPSRDSSASLDSDQPPPGVNWKGSKNKQKKGKRSHETDLYALLGLANERWTANEQQIKNAYRKTCLTEHPDKRLVGVTDEEEKERIEDRFKTIQEAYEVLSDAGKRREYDSTDTFDDTLPNSCDPADFFKVFAPAFRRNSRWSVDTAVPDVGDENTPYAEVERFYNFWYKFKSWREFPHEEEEDVEGAESREHRRWIERNNAKLREPAKKQESRRLRDFVEDAYKIDPRILRKKEEDRQERERKKQEKVDAKLRVMEEEQRKKDEAAAAQAAAEAAEKEARAAAKVEREAAKKLLKRERQRLRALVDNAAGGGRLISDDQTERLTSKLDQLAMQHLNDLLTAAEGMDERRHIALDQLDELDLAEVEEARAKEALKRGTEASLKDAAKRELAKKADAMAEWNDEELRMLDKAVSKWPQGTPKRWEQVTAYIRTRTMDEVLLMVKERKGASSTRLKAQEDWKSAQKKPTELVATADQRANAFSDVEVNLSGSAANTLNVVAAAAAAANAAAVANGTATKASAANASVAARAASQQPSAAPKGSAAVKTSAIAKPTVAAPTASAQDASGPAPYTNGTSGAAPEASTSSTAGGSKEDAAALAAADWSKEQDLMLVAALKQFGKELTDRWDRIGGEVPGKTKAQCFKRFKEMRDSLRAKKVGPGPEGEE